MQTNQAYLGGRLKKKHQFKSSQLDFVSADLGDSTNSDSQWLTVVVLTVIVSLDVFLGIKNRVCYRSSLVQLRECSSITSASFP